MERTADYSEAEKLRRRLEEPLFNPLLKKWVGKGELDYEVYLRTPALLALQTSTADRVHHDELLFQVVHQAQELWLKLVSMEAVEFVADMDGDALWSASARLERIIRTLRCLVAEMNILESMTPDTYQIIRRSLGNGSGQESPGYNAMRVAAEGMEAALDRLLERRQVTLAGVYRASASPEDLKRLCEQFVDIDELFQTWLYTHFQMVRRIIGVDRSIKALDGLPTQVLAGRMTLPLFRKLWEIRVEMTAAWKRDGGYAPGSARKSGSYPAVPVRPSPAAPSAPTAAAHAPASTPGAPPIPPGAPAPGAPSAQRNAPAPESPWAQEPPTPRRRAAMPEGPWPAPEPSAAAPSPSTPEKSTSSADTSSEPSALYRNGVKKVQERP